MPSRAMLSRIWDEVAQAREDASPCLHLNGFEVRRYKGQLWWVKSAFADRCGARLARLTSR
jgi:tRNA(Ile)-lysidine synthase